MAKKKTKLELTWIGKESHPRLEPRILLEDSALSHTASSHVSEDDQFENMLIQGDNLLGLKALEADFSGKVDCVCIDPPYNTGSAFDSYEDGLEHSIWLGLMRDRLRILHRLLAQTGSLWITLDDNEMHYLKVLCDEVFGRQNYVGTIIWEKADSPRMDAKLLSFRHDYLMVIAKDIESVRIGRLDTGTLPKHYDKRDANGRPYYLKPLRAMGGEDSRQARPSMYFGMTAPDGTEVFPIRQDGSDGRWRWGKDRVQRDVSDIDWVDGRDGWSVYYRVYAKGDTTTRPVESIWTHSEVGSNRTSKSEIKKVFGGKVFES